LVIHVKVLQLNIISVRLLDEVWPPSPDWSIKKDWFNKEKRVGQGFCAHGSQCSLHFWIFENFRFSYFSAFKNYDIKYVDRCVYEDWNQKSLVKKYVIFLEMQKRQISDSTLTKYTYYCTTIYSQKFVFFVFSKIQSIF
jgi:hypothetical protein